MTKQEKINKLVENLISELSPIEVPAENVIKYIDSIVNGVIESQQKQLEKWLQGAKKVKDKLTELKYRSH